MTDVLGVLWGKSNAAGSAHLLVAHLFDTAAVGELLWDRYLAPTVRDDLDSCSDGRGRDLVASLCALHDVGKASPAFQSKDNRLAARVRAVGLPIRTTVNEARQWHHTLAGAVVVHEAAVASGHPGGAADWIWPLIAGHHGRIPAKGALLHRRDRSHGGTPWREAQLAVVEYVTSALSIDVGLLVRAKAPTRARQLALAGIVIMADWIASNDQHFSGIATLSAVSMAGARARADRAWAALRLRGGWDARKLAGTDEPDLVARRFDKSSRPLQRAVVRAAEELPAPGLLIVEAPMGEGKTEAAMAAAEVLARRFGADGVFVGMPTQATSDPMFARIRAWLSRVDPEAPIALLHGRSRFNPEWVALRDEVRFHGIGDEYGVADAYESAGDGTSARAAQVAAEWFLGRKRGLLGPVAVGTIDQLLHAATRTKHVMLRHAGLVGRVVVLDEVHAYDVYMSQFLLEALRWLADARVPVVLLSATLPPEQRHALARAYVQGSTLVRDVELALPAIAGYPRVTAINGAGSIQVLTEHPWRDSVPVRVELLTEGPDFDPAIVATTTLDAVREGGCALVVCNTVTRAQAIYRLVRAVVNADAVLLHARLTASTRSERSRRLIEQLGPEGERPSRLVVVATQLAEQSLDVDADILITDLAPIDLLLQRVGRLHRHDRSGRPNRMAAPRVLVAGLRFGEGPPSFPGGSRAVYGEHLLLRSAALVHDALEHGWSIPADVPGLVAKGYGDDPLGPPEWSDACRQARAEHSQREALRVAAAARFLLAGPDELGQPTLDDLHRRHTADLDDDDAVAAVVRDGDPSVEVVLVRRDPRGHRSLSDRFLGPNGEAVSDPDVLADVAGSTVRLPARPEITAAALAELRPLDGWAQDPWLGRMRALILDDTLCAVLGRHDISYDHDLGLIVDRRSR